MGYPCPVPQEGRVRERQGPKVSFKRPNSPQQDQGFTDLNPILHLDPFFSSLLVALMLASPVRYHLRGPLSSRILCGR